MDGRPHHNANPMNISPTHVLKTGSVLLIYPPFGTWDKPYLSIPVLASFLRSKRIPVEALDANNAFYHQFLTRQAIAAGRIFGEVRIAALNDQRRLNLREIIEYCRLVRALAQSQFIPEDPGSVFDPGHPLPHPRKMLIIDSAIRVAAAPYFPESIELPNYLTPFSEYSSRDIALAVQSPSLLQEVFRPILGPLLLEKDLKVAGISVCFPNQILPAFHCAHVIKRLRPDMHVTLGGSAVSCHMRNVNRSEIFKIVDSLVLDDGEGPLESLAGELARVRPHLENVPGLVYLSRGRIHKNRPSPPMDMQVLPTPAYDVLPLERYPLPREELKLPFRLSRGCAWHRCAFCRTGLTMVHHSQQPSPDFLYTQLKSVVDQTGVRNFQFIDDSASPEVLQELSERLIDGHLRITWFANIRFGPRITSELCALLRRAGCRQLKLGLESYNDRLLRLMNKGISTKTIDRVLSSASAAGLDVHANMMVGLPTESERDALDSFNAIWRFYRSGALRSFIYSVFQITPYSRIAEQPEQYGISRMTTPESLDLAPPVIAFEAEGMSRKRARALAARFNGAIGGGNIPLIKQRNGNPLTRLTISGKDIALRHDLRKMRQILESAQYEGLSFQDMIRSKEKSYVAEFFNPAHSSTQDHPEQQVLQS
jgi:anaerobic magnesium-protoporphyrin IX monomethyl ester cyclase